MVLKLSWLNRDAPPPSLLVLDGWFLFMSLLCKGISEDIQKDLNLSKVAVRFGTCAVRQVWLHTKHHLSILKTCIAVCQTSTRCEKSTQRCFWGLWDTRLSCVYCKSKRLFSFSLTHTAPHLVQHCTDPESGWKTPLCHHSCTLCNWPHCGALCAAD